MAPADIHLPIDAFPRGRRIRLLIVDDSVVARSVLERIVTQDERFEVCEKLSNAADAVSYLSGHQVDVIMLDIEMPGQSGLAALPLILTKGRNRSEEHTSELQSLMRISYAVSCL